MHFVSLIPIYGIIVRMKRLLLIILIGSSIFSCSAQNNELLLKKKNKTVRTFFPGKYITLETVEKNYADGIITKITKDSIYIRHFDIERSESDYGGVYIDTAFRYSTVIHVKDINAILDFKNSANRKRNGTILMVAGGGVMVLGAVNGLYRGDPPKDWYKPSGYITAAALMATGFLLRKSAEKRFQIGKKYKLVVIELSIR